MRYGAPYCLTGSGFENYPLIAVDSMLTCSDYVYVQVIVYYNEDILCVTNLQ